MERSLKLMSVRPCRPAAIVRAAIIVVLLLLAVAFSPEAVSAQTGYTGIFGGGPFYKNASANITEIENSGFTEAIVWSVEVSTTGDLNFNGEFPLTSGGAYVGDQYYPNFASDMATAETGDGEERDVQHRLIELRRLGGHHQPGQCPGNRPGQHSCIRIFRL